MTKLTISERASLLKLVSKAIKLSVKVKIHKAIVRLFGMTPRRIKRRDELTVEMKTMIAILIARFASLGLLDDVMKRLPNSYDL